jgi:hypothetical protein
MSGGWFPRRGKAVRIRHERVTVCLPSFLRQASRVYRLWSVSRACRAIGGLSSSPRSISMFSVPQRCSAVAFICLCPSIVMAGLVATYDVGSGSNSATIQFDFENGNTHVATLRWDGVLNGFEALQMVTGGVSGGRLDYLSFSFGKFVTGIGLGADYQYGEGELWPIENYWHYWTAEGDGAFEAAMFGAADRTLQDGSRDAWVFGSSAAPAAIPAPGALGLLVLGGSLRRRRTQQMQRG